MVTVSHASSEVLGLISNRSERLACAPKVCLDVGLLLAGAEFWEVATVFRDRLLIRSSLIGLRPTYLDLTFPKKAQAFQVEFGLGLGPRL